MIRLFLLTLFLGQSSLWAAGSWPATIAVDQSLDDYDDLRIRVKVFPHKRNYLPHQKDWQRDYIELTSDESCRVYRGAIGQTAKVNSPYVLARKLKLHVVNLETPLWIECDKPVTLHRRKTEGESYTYSGQLYVYKHFNRSQHRDEIYVVNIVDIETYLRGVVPSEVYTHWPMESLKSQAVAARTYALFHLNVARQSEFGAKPYNFFYDVDDTILFQAYTGLTNIHERTDDAIAQTHSLVLTYDNKIIQAYYHADSGGIKTESARSVWGQDVPYALAKREPYRGVSKSTLRWKTEVTHRELARRLQSIDVLDAQDKIAWIAPIKKHVTSTGRIKKLLIKTSSGKFQSISTKKLRRVLSLSSNKFVIKIGKEHLIFSGRGSGHGVGMNQRGSQILARHKGWKFEKILSYYYTKTKICSLARRKRDFGSCTEAQIVAKNSRT